MNKYKYLIENVIVFALGNVFSKVVVFLLLAVYTQYLSPQEFGDAELVVTTISLLIPIFTLSISDATLRFLFGDESKKTVVSNGIVVTILGCIVLISLIPLMMMFESIEPYIYYICFLFSSNSVEQLFFSVDKGLEKVKICAFNSVVSVATLTISSYFLIVESHLGLKGYLLSMVLSHLVSAIYLFISGRLYRYIHIDDIDISLIKQMLCYSIPFVPSTIAWWINSLSDRYLIVIFLGSTINGLYSAAAKIPNIISIFTTIFHQAWQLSGIKEYKDESYSTFYSNIYSIFNLLIVTFSSLSLLLLPYLSIWLFKGEFVNSWKYTPFLILGALFSGLSGVLSPAYMAVKKTNILMVSTIVGALINILLNILFLQLFGVQVAAISTFLSFVVLWFIRVRLIKKYVDVKVNWFLVGFNSFILICESLFVIQDSRYFLFVNIGLFIIILAVNYILVKSIVDKTVSSLLTKIKLIN